MPDTPQNPTNLRIAEPGIRALFTMESRWQAWLDVEAALARAEADLGMIPASAAAEIVSKAKVELLDRDRITEGLTRTGHQLVPVVWDLARICDGDAGGYVHWGATTDNITQTGSLLLVRRAHRILLAQMGRILTGMADLAERTADAALPGRTHGQHAVPATFGFKVGVWIDEMCRHVERMGEAEKRVFMSMLGGAAGTFASFGDKGMELHERVADYLEMPPMPVPARTTMDHRAEYVTLLALLAATCGKIAREIYTLMKQEFGEVEEPVPAGTVGSSTMPQKRNPKLTQDIIAGAAKVRALVPLALEAMQTEHEADRTCTLMMRDAVEPACETVGDMLERMAVVMDGLSVDPERMRRNLDLSGGLILGEALMLDLGAEIGRQDAHDAIYDAAQAAATTGRPFAELLAEDETVRRHLSPEDIAAKLDPEAYTGSCAAIATAQAKRARTVAGELAG
jgi:adenylosuccinate lyase